MMEEFKAADEEQVLVLEEEFRELALKEGELLEQLTEVRDAKQRVRRLVAEKKNRYASIYTLPDELLVCIVEAGQLHLSNSALTPEVLASHISQRFRWVVLGAPPLWTAIELCWGVTSNAERFAAYLQRSQACALSVTLKYDTYEGTAECDYDEIPNELPTIALYISRIRWLVIQCGGGGLSFEDVRTHLSDLHAPYLEHINICSIVSVFQPEEDQYALLFNQGAPRLTTLKLSNVRPISHSPWIHSLTSVDLRNLESPLEAFLLNKILTGCPHLTNITLDESTYFFIGTPFDNHVPMLSLRSLTAICLNSDNADALLKGVIALIHAPALENLQFSGVHGTQISTFFNRLSRSKFPALQSLTFVNSSIRCKLCHILPARIQPSALRHFAALTSLTIVNMCYTNQLLEDLLATSLQADGSSGGLSLLHTLTLGYKDADDFGIASWPRLGSGVTHMPVDTHDPLRALRTIITSRQKTLPICLRLPRSRFFTGRDWDHSDAPLEIFNVHALLQALGHSGDDEISNVF
ncbi:hypothetical protein B0H10DRAFT_2047896 [Mycena sp. CBHHK59/15]|nr:hypothetical protein B0H10DRAFT_2047896 [Mycena sp. CBHHK59/15]